METSFAKACPCTGSLVPDHSVEEHCHMDGEGHEHPGEGDPRPPGVVVVQAQVRRKVGSWKSIFMSPHVGLDKQLRAYKNLLRESSPGK